MSVVEAVTRALEAMGPEFRDSVLGASALAMAAELDDVHAEEECEGCGHVQSWTTSHNSATSKAMCAKELRETISVLRELAPPERETDGIDDLSEQRERRRREAARVAAS